MYKRILLKLSGEALSPKEERNTLDSECIGKIAAVIKKLHDDGVQIGIVIGAGNIWRGKLAQKIGIERVPADFMGMLGTVINAVALSSALKNIGVDSIVFSALSSIDGVCEIYDKEKAKIAIGEGKVCFFAGGTGKPFFTTDTAATLRALEVECDAIFMAKYGIEGVYDKDPRTYSDAKFLPTLTYQEIIDRKLEVMDMSAVELVKDTDIELRVFAMSNPDNILNVIKDSSIGTTVRRK